jgi:TM2 domain-containing membrane protein YozV
MTPADKDEYDRLGLSQVEWEMIQKAKMPKSKIYELLKCGISITEYFTSPWLEVRMSEDEWVGRRKSGESSIDIKTKERRREEEAHKISRDQWMTLQGFFLPGLHQFIRKEPVRGYFMSGIAVAGLVFFIYRTISAKTFQPMGLFFLVPDMLWSGVDLGIQIQKEQNPEASRFTQARRLPASVALSVSFPLHN